ncbi:MAG TPA: TIGR03435 family protein [Acidobacteriaceae bacterium]|jgi:uncharacterized protein (TIGR03435 family)
MPRIPSFFALVILALMAGASPGLAQIHFDVSSIHPSRPGASPQSGRIGFLADGFDAHDSTVGDILDMLNDWQLHRVVGGPAWMTTDRFDIQAKASEPIPGTKEMKVELKAAVMALLAERFKLAVHHETRDLPAMVLLAPNKSGGIKPATSGETPSVPYFSRDRLTFTAVPMAAVTNYLSNVFQSTVVDQTGLQGAFDFTLEPSATEPGATWADRVRDALTVAGFRLEEKKVPVEITVIDHCERPGEN